MSKNVVYVLVGALVLGLVVVVAGAGAYWYLKGGSQPIGPLAGEAAILPGDSTFLLGVDVKHVTAGANYKKYFADSLKEGGGGGLKELETKTGINVERDVDAVFLAGQKSGPEPVGVVLCLGRFDAAKVGQAAQAEGKGKTTTKTVNGVTVYEIHEGEKVPAELAVPSPNLLLMGNPGPLEAALANLKGGSKGVATNPELVGLLKGVPAGTEIWFVAGKALLAELPKPGAGGPNIPPPNSLMLTANVNPAVGLELTGEMADDTAAKNLADTLNGFKAMAAMMGSDKPEVKDLANALSVKAEAKRVALALQLTPAMLDEMKKSMEKAKTSANESAAIGDTRAVISAQAAYQSQFGHYGELRCLAQPKSCDASYEGPQYLDEGVAGLGDKAGYKRGFQAGAKQDTGFVSYAYTAQPLKPGESGVRSFCGDDTGVICVNENGAPFAPSDGHCPQGCTPLN